MEITFSGPCCGAKSQHGRIPLILDTQTKASKVESLGKYLVKIGKHRDLTLFTSGTNIERNVAVQLFYKCFCCNNLTRLCGVNYWPL
jgi:hypothetical protein